MDQWNLRAHINQYSQPSGQGASAQYSYNSSTYASQQPQQQQQQQQQAPSSGSAAYNPQAYLQQNVGSYGGGGTAYGQWSQRPQSQQADQTQAGYGASSRVSAQVPSGGAVGAAASGNQYPGQYGGMYGVPQQQQQLMGVASKASDYQASGGGGGAASRSSSAYGGGGIQDRPVASGASYVAGGGGVSPGGVYDSSKYLPSAGYVGKAVEYANQYNTPKSSSADHQYMTSSYPGVKPPDSYASQVYEQLQQQVARVAAATGGQDITGRAVLGNAGYGAPGPGDASGLLASLGGAGGLANISQHQGYGGAGGGSRGMSAQVYPGSPTLGYGGVSLPPGRDYGSGRVSGGSLFQREGSYGRERPSIGSSRFDDRERERSERERKREELREREREQREMERRERERERREEEQQQQQQRRRERTPPLPRLRRDASPLVRREEKSRRESSPRREARHASPSKEKRREYVCKIDPVNVIEPERDYASITRRYSRLTVAPEFTKYILSWMGMENRISLEKPVSFEHDSIDVEDDHPEPVIKSSDKQKPAVVWNVKVMLMSGLTEECVGELLSDKLPEKPINFHKFLKFVALRRDRNAIMAAGARWDKSLDGGDPAVDDNALIRTGIRCLKELLQLDLSECKTWIRFGEVHYDRMDSDGFPSYKEISVIFLPDISGCVPSPESWSLQWTQRKQAKVDREAVEKKETTPSDKDPENESANGVVEKNEDPAVKDEKEDKKEKEEPTPEPGFILMTKRSKSTKLRSMTISLDGLLDYDESDKDECTFELSLFAEAFAEMLQFRKGNLILSSLEALRKASHLRRKEEKKRARQAEPGKDHETKRVKSSEATKANPDEAPKPTSSEAIESPGDNNNSNKNGKEATIEAELKPSATPTPEVEPEEKDEGQKKEKNGGGNNKKEKEKKEKIVVVDKELLKAYRYFDKNKVGYIKTDDMKKLLHSLGKSMSSKHVKDLISCAVSESGKRDDKLMYRNLTDKEVSHS